MMNNKVVWILLLMLVFGVVGFVQVVDFQYVDIVGLNIYILVIGFGYQIGEMQFVMGSGVSFEVYCVELVQGNVLFDSGLVNYIVGNFMLLQVSLLQGLYLSIYVLVLMLQDKVVFQMVIWEIMEEFVGLVLSVYIGNFQFGVLSLISIDVENIVFVDKIDGYLMVVISYSGLVCYMLIKMVNLQFQDYVMVFVVLEFESYVLLFVGLGVVGFIVCCCVMC